MRLTATNILSVELSLAVVLVSSNGLALEQKKGDSSSSKKADSTSGTKKEVSISIPKLAEIIPSSTKLSGRLTALKKELTVGLNVSALETQYAEIESNLRKLSIGLRKLKAAGDPRYNKIAELKQAIDAESTLLDTLSKPMNAQHDYVIRMSKNEIATGKTVLVRDALRFEEWLLHP
jgi:hypothetical protein